MRFEIGKEPKPVEEPVRLWLDKARDGSVNLIATRGDDEQILASVMPVGVLKLWPLGPATGPRMGFLVGDDRRITTE